jgi:hypothetical protein
LLSAYLIESGSWFHGSITLTANEYFLPVLWVHALLSPALFLRHFGLFWTRRYSHLGRPLSFWTPAPYLASVVFLRVFLGLARGGSGSGSRLDPYWEMEFLNAILVEVSGHKLESSQTGVFYPHFSILQNAIHE